jgi:hypothetical protein
LEKVAIDKQIASCDPMKDFKAPRGALSHHSKVKPFSAKKNYLKKIAAQVLSEIANCGSGSGSFLFITDLKKFE